MGMQNEGGLSYGNRDPIAAQATPPGESALALVRTSGGGPSAGISGGAIELLARVFSRPEKLLSAPGNSIIHGWILRPGDPAGQGKGDTAQKKIDEVLVSVYRAPRSFTGEDGADISCHGGIASAKAVMTALKMAGFREALPGEFSFRAFMNGKLDLTRAESVMELVSAKTGRSREQAVRRLAGALEKEISAIKAMLVNVLAGTEIYLDYSEDEFFGNGNNEEAGRLPERKSAEEAARRLNNLSGLWSRERIYADGALAVIAGKPNAGKSSLFNYLIREDRSIVTNVPGTTRDWIEAHISVDDIPLRLADTAGLKPFGFIGPEKPDEAEQIGIQRSLELLEKADLVLYVIDASRGIDSGDMDFLLSPKDAFRAKQILVLWNKADLVPLPPQTGKEFPYPVLAVSAATGEGIPALLDSAANLLKSASSLSSPEPSWQDAAGPGTTRQKELIDAALTSVEEALALAASKEPLDLIAPLFRSAVNALGEITGEVFTDDILEAMFGRFCVGK